MVEICNICIEQCIGTLCGGCTEAICAWLPHLMETCCAPLLGENLEQSILALFGKV